MRVGTPPPMCEAPRDRERQLLGDHVSTIALKTCALALTTLTDANWGTG